ncbi:MAG: hypothetical protein HQM01_00030 [Magnetococcales bacterium]|nr:hypothetical protein [Magnetococcales bacterium]
MIPSGGGQSPAILLGRKKSRLRRPVWGHVRGIVSPKARNDPAAKAGAEKIFTKGVKFFFFVRRAKGKDKGIVKNKRNK